MHIQSQTFQPANTGNIDALQALTRTYVRSLIGSSDEPVQRPMKRSGHHSLSVDEEVKRLRAEEDLVNIQLNQTDQSLAVLQSAMKQEYEKRAKLSLGHFEIKRQLEGVLLLRVAKLPNLPRAVLSRICEQYQLNDDEILWKQKNRYEITTPRWYPGEGCDPGLICSIICGQHKSISVKLDEQFLRDKIRQDGAARLNVSTSMNFSANMQHAFPLSLQALDTALESGDRWDKLSINEDHMVAVDFVLRRCEWVLPHLRVLDISEQKSWMYETSQGKISLGYNPRLIPESRLQDAKVPLGYVLHSKWLFERVTCLNLCLPAKLDQPSGLVDCLDGLTELRHLTLRVLTEFDVQSYAAEKVALLPKLVELELMFDNFDTNMLASMLHTFSCPNLKKYVTHFIPRLDPMRHPPTEPVYDLWAVVDATVHGRPIGYPPSDVWALLDGRFPSLQHFAIANYSESWRDMAAERHTEELIFILAELTAAHGRWLFPHLSSLTLPMRSRDGYRCDLYPGLLRLAVARAKQANISNINSVTMYGDDDFDCDDEALEALKFHIPNLCFK